MDTSLCVCTSPFSRHNSQKHWEDCNQSSNISAFMCIQSFISFSELVFMWFHFFLNCLVFPSPFCSFPLAFIPFYCFSFFLCVQFFWINSLFYSQLTPCHTHFSQLSKVFMSVYVCIHSQILCFSATWLQYWFASPDSRPISILSTLKIISRRITIPIHCLSNFNLLTLSNTQTNY